MSDNTVFLDAMSTANEDGPQTTWIFSPLCRAKITCNWTQAGTRSRTQGSVPQFHEEIWTIRSQEPVKSQEGKQPFHFLPHHPVFKATSTTTHTRVVFDGGAKTSNGLSLNDILQVGPTVQQDLYSIVLRFRTHRVCFTADSKNVPSD